mgnify:CR=1 FL=1
MVAHGLAMSVNGQDPRANVYLLDGTLLNDFTNGPAGSAAGTALGMDDRRVQGDLKRFKELIEQQGSESGAWRGEVENPSD